MSELEPQFEYDLKEIAGQCYNPYEPLAEEDIRKRIGETVRAIGLLSQNQYLPRDPTETEHDFERRLGAEHFTHNTDDAVPVAAFMIVNQHPFLNGWEDYQKRYFLDYAFTKELAELERSKAIDLYFPNAQTSSRNITEENKINSYRELRSRLRQRISTKPKGVER